MQLSIPCHSGTGGFRQNQSIGAYNSLYIEIVVAVFMVMSGTNFSLYFHLYNKNRLTSLKMKNLDSILLLSLFP